MGYLKTTVSAISWSMAGRWILRGFTFIRLALLARILSPVQFGVFGVATLVLGFLEIVTETWINIFLVQEEGGVDKYIDTAWIISIVRGSLIFTLIFASAGAISEFFNSPDSLSVIRLIAFVPLVRGMINPAVAKLQKHLLYRLEFGYRSGLFLIEALVAISVSLVTRSAIGLGVGMLAGACVEVLLSFILFSPRPTWKWSGTIAREIFSRGKWITAAGILNYVYQNGDNLVVGRLLGTGGLGLYDPAYKISGLPVSEVSDVISKVTFPVFVRLRPDPVRLQAAFARTFAISNLITFSAGILILIFARELILLVLGPGWLTAVPALRVLSISGIAKAVISSIYPLFLAVQRQNYVTWVTFTACLILMVSILPLVSVYGLVGAGLAATSASLLSLPLAGLYVYRIFFTSAKK